MDAWIAEKTINNIKQIIFLRCFLRERTDQTVKMAWGETFGEVTEYSFYVMLNNLTKVLSLACGNLDAWGVDDKELIIRLGEQGLNILIGKYSNWDFLEAPEVK